MAKYISKHIGGVAAVAILDDEGRVVTIDLHTPVGEDYIGEVCKFIGGRRCHTLESYLSSEFEGRKLGSAQLDKVLYRVVRSALYDKADTEY